MMKQSRREGQLPAGGSANGQREGSRLGDTQWLQEMISATARLYRNMKQVRGADNADKIFHRPRRSKEQYRASSWGHSPGKCAGNVEGKGPR